jgi:hypothetical protein
MACPFHPFAGSKDSDGCTAFRSLWAASLIVPMALDATLLAREHKPAHADRMAIAPWFGRQSGGVMLRRAF